MLIDDLDIVPEWLTDGYRGIMLIKRNKDGGEGNAHRKAIKAISRDSESWKSIIENFLNLQLTSHIGFRIYASVNSKRIEKAIHEFKRRQLESDYGNDKELDWFYIDVQNRFFSCLMNERAKESQNFLIDCDSEMEYEDAITQIPENLILFDYATKNGRHLITKPFNTSEIRVQIKKDDMLSIA